jgi:hypothetical protein
MHNNLRGLDKSKLLNCLLMTYINIIYVLSHQCTYKCTTRDYRGDITWPDPRNPSNGSIHPDLNPNLTWSDPTRDQMTFYPIEILSKIWKNITYKLIRSVFFEKVNLTRPARLPPLTCCCWRKRLRIIVSSVLSEKCS